MKNEQVLSLIAHLRSIGKDTSTCEVKSAGRKLPSSMIESVCAFANSSGGTVILGLEEKNGFKPVPGFDATAIQDAFVACLNRLTPRPQPELDIVPFENSTILVAEIPVTRLNDRPCYITERGMYKGSFIRTADGDRLMTPYEIDRLVEAHRPPRWDAEPVSEATPEDLDTDLLDKFLSRQQILHPRVFLSQNKETILFNLRVLAKDVEGVIRPTVAGLMCLGVYPQKYFPSLVIRASVYPYAADAGRTDIGGCRFTDSAVMVGPIPTMLADAMSFVDKNTRRGSVVEGAFRRDVPDYPTLAVREAIANALQHRDYSPVASHSPIQLRLYTDRLVIENPGPLFGTMTVESLGVPGKTAQRNPFLSTILEATACFDGRYVVENYGTGIPTIEEELAKAQMQPARFVSDSTHFSTTFLLERTLRAHKKTGAAETLMQILSDGTPRSAVELSHVTGIGMATVRAALRRLCAQETLRKTEPDKSPRQKYALAHPVGISGVKAGTRD